MSARTRTTPAPVATTPAPVAVPSDLADVSALALVGFHVSAVPADPSGPVVSAARTFLAGGDLAPVHVAMLAVGRDDRPAVMATALATLAGTGDPARFATLAAALVNPVRPVADPAVALALAIATLRVADLALVQDQDPAVVARATALADLALAGAIGPDDVSAVLAGADRAVRAVTRTTRPTTGGTTAPAGTRTRTTVDRDVAALVGRSFPFTYRGQHYVVTCDGADRWTDTTGTTGTHPSPTAAVRAMTGQASVNGWRTLGL